MTQLFCVTAVLLCATLAAGAQPSEQLQQQLQPPARNRLGSYNSNCRN